VNTSNRDNQAYLGAPMLKSITASLLQWFDTQHNENKARTHQPKQIDWVRVVPFIGVHLACLGIFWVGFSKTALFICLGLYALRMFAITGFYHRYFSHRAFKTNRFWQCVFGIIGASAVQRGPLWWAAHHRDHHVTSDQAEDKHSPHQHGFLWSHCGWFLASENFSTQFKRISDFARFPELRLLDRFDIFVPILLAVSLFFLGHFLQHYFPGLHTSGSQLLIWGFFVSTVITFHATFAINSLTHVFGKRRYATKDQSRNNLLLALITFGEGWHNNHHHFPGAARQGFYWWEIDITYYFLCILSWLRIIHDLKRVPPMMRDMRDVHA